MIKKLLNTVLILNILICTTYAEMLDSGDPFKKDKVITIFLLDTREILENNKPIQRSYTVSEVSQYLGTRIFVHFIEENIESQIIVRVEGILVSRYSKGEFLLLGKTEYKNRIVIPIKTISYIQSVK